MGILDISGSALYAERLRMNIISQNLANVNTTRDKDGLPNPYRRREVVFRALFNPELGEFGVVVPRIEKDMSPFKIIYKPGHPDADENGYVKFPNVNPIVEFTDMITAARSYEANLSVIETTKDLLTSTIRILG